MQRMGLRAVLCSRFKKKLEISGPWASWCDAIHGLTLSHSSAAFGNSIILYLYYCDYCRYNDIKLYILFLYHCFTMNSLILLIHVSVAYWNKYHQIKPSTLIIPTFAVNTIYEILRQAVPISISEPLSPTLVCVFLRYQFAIFAHKSFLFFSINPFFFFFFQLLMQDSLNMFNMHADSLQLLKSIFLFDVKVAKLS